MILILLGWVLDFSLWVFLCLVLGFCIGFAILVTKLCYLGFCGLEFGCMVIFFAFSFPGIVLNFDEVWGF